MAAPVIVPRGVHLRGYGMRMWGLLALLLAVAVAVFWFLRAGDEPESATTTRVDEQVVERGVAPAELRGAAEPDAARPREDEASAPTERAPLPPADETCAFDVLVSSEGAGAPPADLWIVTLGRREPLQALRTDDAGRARVTGLGEGVVYVVAAASGCGRASTVVKLPREAQEPVELRLPLAHSLEIRVVDQDTEQGIAGAVVLIRERIRRSGYVTTGHLVSHPESVTTNEEGVVLLAGLGGTEQLTLSATADGYPPPALKNRSVGPGRAWVQPGTDEVTIPLAAPRTVRWPIEVGAYALPANGTRTEIEPWTNTGRAWVPPEGIVENGSLVVAGWGAEGASGYAVAPDGAIARFAASAEEDVGRPITFYPQRTITVRVRREGGPPIEGWWVTARDQGGNPVRASVATDAEGVARLERLYGGPMSLVDVAVHEVEAHVHGGLPAGSVNLAEGDGDLEVVVLVERRIRMAVEVDGRPGLPPGTWKALLGGHPVQPLESNAEEGTVTLPWRPRAVGETTKVWVFSKGYLPEPAEVTAGGPDEVLEARVKLEPAGQLVVHVDLPEDGRHKVVLQSWLTEERKWSGTAAANRHDFSQGRRADESGVLRFELLRTGRYRVVDDFSGIASEAFDVVAGAGATEGRLDLRSSGWVKGRVEVPEGLGVEGVSVGIDGAPPVQVIGRFRLPRGRVGAAGEFQVRVPGNRPVTVRPHHATLVPAEVGGRVTVTRPQDGLVLRLVEGALAVFRFDQPMWPQVFTLGRSGSLDVKLFDGPVAGEPVATLVGLLQEDRKTLHLGGFRPGTYTVWIDTPPFAPTVLKNLKLEDGLDSGEATELDRGSTFVLRIRVKEGSSPPRHSVWVHFEGEPAYSRSMDVSSEEIRVIGIGSGRFRVTAVSYGVGGRSLDEVIEFDGANTVERTIDLR